MNIKRINNSFMANIATAIIFTVLSLVFTIGASAQGSQPPPPPGDGGTGTNSGGNQTGGNAPIGGGSLILLGLAAVYGGKKVYSLKNNGEGSATIES